MLVKEKKFQEEDGSIGYYDAVYDSSNILGTTYFPKRHALYISFNRGGVYSYSNVTPELYEEFKAAESQGKFFAKTIKSQPETYKFLKEFTLYPQEVADLKEVVEENREEMEENTIPIEEANGLTFNPAPQEITPMITLNQADPTNIIFYIEGEEMIRLDKKGFHWKGKLVEDDEDIYDDFTIWLDKAMQNQE